MPRYLRLLWRDKGAVCEALCFVLAARCFLVLVPFRKTVAFAAWLNSRFPARGPGDRERLDRLSHLVSRASHFVPGATCLTQALTLKWMLMRRRVACQLRIGVAKDADGIFKAHAWLETASQRVLIGGNLSPQTYKPLKFNLEKSL